MTSPALASALYDGVVQHRRFGAVTHRFRYRLALVYLDLGEVDSVFARHPLWSANRRALVRFRRSDYLGPSEVPLEQAVGDMVEGHTGRRPTGPVRMLAAVRTLGWCFNPITLYYCFDVTGSEVETIVVQVTNTPWGERHTYVVEGGGDGQRHEFDKALHVSPFMPMDHRYSLRAPMPGERLFVHLENRQSGRRVFDAHLLLRRTPITRSTLGRRLRHQPLSSIKISAAIYWEALRLWRKGARYHPHPTPQPESVTS